MNTYTKECNYTNIFDIRVRLHQIDQTLDMLFNSTAQELSVLKESDLKGYAKSALNCLERNFECFALVVNAITDLKEDCYALEKRTE